MALEGSTLLAGLGGKGGPPPAPSGLNSPWLVLNRGPPSAAARSRTSTRRGPPTGGGRRLPSGAGDAPATRAAAAARAAMLQQQRRRLPGTAPVTRSSADAPRSGLTASWGVSSDCSVGGPPGAPEGLGGGPPCSSRARQVLLEALMRVKKKDKKQFFAVAVDSKLVPDYHLVVREPMHFEAIREKIENGVYQEFSEFDKDIALIVANCRLYNHPDTPFCRAAALVEGCWEKFRDRFKAKFAAAQQADAAAAAAAAAATEGKEDKHTVAAAADRPEDNSAERDIAAEQPGEVGRSLDAEEVHEIENVWNRQRLAASLLMRSACNPRAAAALGLLQQQAVESTAAADAQQQTHPAEEAPSHGVVSSNPLTDPFFWFSFMLPDAALEAEAAERAAAGDTAAGAAAGAAAGGGEGPLGSLQAASKGFNVLEYPMQPLPGSRSMMRRHQGSRNLSYNASMLDFLGAEALKRLEADCPQLRLTVRRLKQKEPPKSPLTDIRLFGIDTPDFSEFNSRLRFDQSLLLGVGEAHVLSARTLSRIPSSGGPPSASTGGAYGAPGAPAVQPPPICTDVLLALCGTSRISSSSNPVAAAVFAQEQQQMRLRLLQAAAKAAAAAATPLGRLSQRPAREEGGALTSPATRGPPLKRLKTDAAEAEGTAAAAAAGATAAAAAGPAASVKPSEEAAAATQTDAALLQQGDKVAAAAAAAAAPVAGTSGAPPRNLPVHFDALYDLLLSTPQQKQQLQQQMQQQLLLQQQQGLTSAHMLQQQQLQQQQLQQQRLRRPGPPLPGAPLQGPPLGALPGPIAGPISGLAQQQQQLLRQNRQLNVLQQQLQQQQLQQQQLQQHQVMDAAKQQVLQQQQQQVQQNVAAAAAAASSTAGHSLPPFQMFQQQHPQLLLQQQPQQLQQQLLQQQLLLQRQQQQLQMTGQQPAVAVRTAQLLQQLHQLQQPQQQLPQLQPQQQSAAWPQR